MIIRIFRVACEHQLAAPDIHRPEADFPWPNRQMRATDLFSNPPTAEECEELCIKAAVGPQSKQGQVHPTVPTTSGGQVGHHQQPIGPLECIVAMIR